MNDGPDFRHERDCEQCAARLTVCPACDGQAGGFSIAGRLTCTECADTGRLCPVHGKDWKR